MDAKELARITPGEITLMLDISKGLAYRVIASRRGRTVASVERAVERLRGKLRSHGGGNKVGLALWVNSHYAAWTVVTGFVVSDDV